MTDIQFNVDAALAKLGDLVTAHGQQAVDIAAQVVQVNAINSLTGIPLYGSAAIIAAVFAKWCYRKVVAGKDDRYSDDTGWWIGFWAACFVSFCMLIAALFYAADVWAWVALFNPKLALAHEIMQRLGGH